LAAFTCLFLRKQPFGNKQFINFLSIESSLGLEKALSVYGWSDVAEFNRTSNNYIHNLLYDIRVKRTPDMGLTWFSTGDSF